MNKIIDIAPLIIFVALILVLLTFLSEKEDQLESVLIDSTFPEFSIASLKDPKRNLSKKIFQNCQLSSMFGLHGALHAE